MSPIRLVACSDWPRDRTAFDDGVHSIPAIVVSETGRVRVDLGGLFRHQAVVDESARAAS
jgi:hypothetical protein